MTNLFETLGNALNPFPQNPVKIFTLVERLRSNIKGNSMLANHLRHTFELSNYYQLIKEVQDMIAVDRKRVGEIIGHELVNEIDAFVIPEKFLIT